jgi:putative ABC transport system permease protein
LARRLFGKELYHLFYGRVEQKQEQGSRKGNVLSLVVGIVLLGVAYGLTLSYFKALAGIPLLLATLLLVVGTPLLIRGVARLLSQRAVSARGRQTQGLRTFTLRQFQENLVNRSTSVAAASILTMFALMFIAAGASVLLTSGSPNESSVYHFTVQGDEEQVEQFLASDAMQPYVAHLNRLDMGYLQADGQDDERRPLTNVEWEGLREKIVSALPAGSPVPEPNPSGGYHMDPNDPLALQLLVRMDSDMEFPYLIAASSYNRVLEAAGAAPLDLQDDEVTFYLNPDFYALDKAETAELMSKITQDGAGENADADGSAPLSLRDHPLRVAPLPAMYQLITDRTVTLVFALIVPDALFETLVDPSNHDLYWNFCIPEELEAAEGMMAPISEASELLAGSGLQYESYLQNFGRQLFYGVAGSYTLLYTGFIFLIIGCTVLALQFLTQMRQTMRRYLTLSMLGAERAQMKRSLRQQVAGQFLLPLALACISGTVGLNAMTSLFSLHIEDSTLLYPLALAFVCLIVLVEVLYAVAVARTAEHELDKLRWEPCV